MVVTVVEVRVSVLVVKVEVNVVVVPVEVSVVVKGKHSSQSMHVAQVQSIDHGSELARHESMHQGARVVIVVVGDLRLRPVGTTGGGAGVGAGTGALPLPGAGVGAAVWGLGDVEGDGPEPGGADPGAGGLGMTSVLHSMHDAHVGQPHLMNHWWPLPAQ